MEVVGPNGITQQKQIVLEFFEEKGHSLRALASCVVFPDVYLEAHLLPGP